MNTYYIGDMPVTDELYHHGILGQKWGVRRYQNPDGTLTAEGKKRLVYRNRTISANRTRGKVNDIIGTMSESEKRKLAIDNNEEYLTFEQGSSVVKRILSSDKSNTPISFFDLLEDGDTIQIALGTRSGDQYRGKGYASKAAQKGMAWYEKNKEKFGYKQAVWGVRVDNEPSIRMAKKLGFEIDNNSYSDDGQWVNYIKR